MIDNILTLLSLDDWHCESEFIDIAKGKYKAPLTFKEMWKQSKRKALWQLRK